MITQWLESRFGEVIMASSGLEARVCCPFCVARVGRSDTKFHLYVSTTLPVGHCFRCSWKGNYVSLIMSVDGCSYSEALCEIESPTPNVGGFDNLGAWDLIVHSPRGLVQGKEVVAFPVGYVPLVGPSIAHHMSCEEKAVRRYLRVRDIPVGLIHDRFGWVSGTNRVWMLVDNAWWQGRLIISGEPKYISPPWPKGDSLWNATALSGNVVDICEGVFSAIAVGPTAVALCGKTINDEQLKRIVKMNPRGICLRLDADACSDAHSMADRFVQFGYSGHIDVQYMKLGDPAGGVLGRKIMWDWESRIVESMSL